MATGNLTRFQRANAYFESVYVGVVGSTVQLTSTIMAYLSGITVGTAYASKALVLGAAKEIATITTATITNLNSTTVVATDVDAGASGTAGTVDIFPTTASRGKIQIAATASTGDTTTTVTNAAQSATATMTIPDTNGSASFVMTAAAQTVGGVKTFSSMPVIPVAAVNAAGNNLATATQLVAGLSVVALADDTAGVKLPAAAAAGTICIVKSTVSNKILKVYPDASSTINAIGANAAISLASGPTIAMFFASSTTQWYTLPLLPS